MAVAHRLPLCCPSCGTPLAVDDEAAACSAPSGCGRSFPRRQGILSFGDPSFFYGELSRERTRSLIDHARATTVASAIEAIEDPQKRSWMRSYVLDDSRGDWQFFVDLGDRDPSEALLVDVGSGFGAVARSFAPHVGTVCAIDGTLERLEVSALCARDQGLENVVPLHADALTLPLPQGVADAVVVMGVLEWVPLADEQTPVEQVQLRFLRQVARILRPGGQLVLGIENRWGYNYLLGEADEHTGVWGTNLLPRRMADRRMRAAKGRPFRNYTYGRTALAALLAQAGLEVEETLAAIPKYRAPDMTATLRTSTPLAHYLRSISAQPGIAQLAGRVATATGVAPELVPTFIQLARKAAA